MSALGQPKPPDLTAPDDIVHEFTPLLPKKNADPSRKWPKSVVYRVLLTAFFVSLSFGVTQVPLVQKPQPN
jgi:hypothetical protein